MSADLTWQIIRNNSCFLRGQRGINKKFSLEPFNLQKKNSPRFNGLINKKAIDITAAADGKGVVVSTKVRGKMHKPAQSVKSVTIKNASKATRSVKALAKEQGLGAFSKFAQRRVWALLNAQQRQPRKKITKKVDA